MKTLPAILLVMSIVAFSVTPGCRGASGPQGPKGDQGSPGSQPTREELLALVRNVVAESADQLRGREGSQGPKGDPGGTASIYETSLGVNYFDTSIAGQTWLPGLALTFTVSTPSKVVTIATGRIVLRAGSSFAFRVGLGTATNDPGVKQEYRGQFGLSETTIPLALSRTFSLGPGTHTIHLLAYNETGAQVIRDAVLTAIIVR